MSERRDREGELLYHPPTHGCVKPDILKESGDERETETAEAADTGASERGEEISQESQSMEKRKSVLFGVPSTQQK